MAQQYTRKLIQETFINLLDEKPLSKITVKEIVTACEINRNTFYYYYDDIYAILTEYFSYGVEQAVAEFNNTLSWEEGFITATKFALDHKKAIYHVYYSLQKDELEDFLYNIAGNVMQRYVERQNEDIHASDDDVKMIALFYQCALTEMVMHWIKDGMKEEPEEFIHKIGKLFDGNIGLSLQRSLDITK